MTSTCSKFSGGGINSLQEGVRSRKRVASSCAVRKSVSESVGYGAARTFTELWINEWVWSVSFLVFGRARGVSNVFLQKTGTLKVAYLFKFMHRNSGSAASEKIIHWIKNTLQTRVLCQWNICLRWFISVRGGPVNHIVKGVWIVMFASCVTWITSNNTWLR